MNVHCTVFVQVRKFLIDCSFSLYFSLKVYFLILSHLHYPVDRIVQKYRLSFNIIFLQLVIPLFTFFLH